MVLVRLENTVLNSMVTVCKNEMPISSKKKITGNHIRMR